MSTKIIKQLGWEAMADKIRKNWWKQQKIVCIEMLDFLFGFEPRNL
jgi:hypothetical protein